MNDLSWTGCDWCVFCRVDVQPVETGNGTLWLCQCCRERMRDA